MPPDMDPQERAAVLEAEAVRGRELIDQGKLIRIWRVPGRTANVSLYRCADADEVHDLLTSLPAFPWIDAQVQALATHPLEK